MRRSTTKQAPVDHHDQQEVVVGRAQAAEQRKRRHPAQVGIRNVRQALLPAGDRVPLEADRPYDLREREREHREVDARGADAEEAEHDGECRGHHAGRDEGEWEWHTVGLHQNRAGVRPDAKVSGVAERDEPGVAKKQIETHREQGEDRDLGREERGEARAEPRHAQQGDPDEQRPRNACPMRDRKGGCQPFMPAAGRAGRRDARSARSPSARRLRISKSRAAPGCRMRAPGRR